MSDPGDHHRADGVPGPGSSPPPAPSTTVPPPPMSEIVTVIPTRTPLAGETTPLWRLVVVVVWVAVAVAIGSVWKTSDQLGLSTWWLGPRGDPQPRAVQLLPFVPSLLMVMAAINNARRLPWLGLLASAAVIAVGVADLGRFARLGLIEIAIGVAAAAASLASTSGVLHPVAPPAQDARATVDEATTQPVDGASSPFS